VTEYFLKEMKIEVTKKCPLACIHCSSDSNEQQLTEISTEKCMDIIRQAVSMGLKELSFSGGEPLVWNGIVDAVKLASDSGLKVNLYTSGNVIDVNKTFEQLSNAGLTKAIFSLYSDQKEEHIRITRKQESFDKTFAAIEAAQRNRIKTEVHFVALKKTFHKLENVVRLVASKGVERVSVLRFVPQGRGSILDVLSKEDNAELSSTINRLRKEGFEIRTGSPYNVLLLNDEPKCMAGQDRLIITPDLKVYPCDAFKQINSVDVVDTDIYSSIDNNSLSTCWDHSLYFNSVRKAIHTPPEGQCKICPVYSKCLSGCLAQKYIVKHSLNPNSDPACTRN